MSTGFETGNVTVRVAAVYPSASTTILYVCPASAANRYELKETFAAITLLNVGIAGFVLYKNPTTPCVIGRPVSDRKTCTLMTIPFTITTRVKFVVPVFTSTLYA